MSDILCLCNLVHAGLQRGPVQRFGPQRHECRNPVPQPGIVLRFSTDISTGKNLFGKPLSGGDQAFSTSNFATKILGLGVAFEGYQTGARMVSGSELEQHMPGLKTKLKAALFTPQDGRAEPQWVAPALAEAARDQGAVIMTNCAVRCLDLKAGRVAGVYTERGRVACDQVVLAGGAWSRLFAGNEGIALPQLKVLNTVLRTSPVEPGPETALWSDDFAIRKRADGGYTIASGHENTVDIVPDSFRLAAKFLPAFAQEWKSLRFRLSHRWTIEARQRRSWTPTDVTPFELCRILDPEPSQKALRKSWAKARQALPALVGAEIVQSWAGMIDVTPDAIPVISNVQEIQGLVIATGFSGHGFGIGPGAGRLVADLVMNTAPCVDPAAFRLSRFSDGTKVRPDPGY